MIFLQGGYYEGAAIAYQEGLTDFLTDLGFEVPTEIDQFVRDAEGSQAFIPLEQLTVLDTADVLVWATESEAARRELGDAALYPALEEVKAGREVFTDGLVAGAIYFTSPLSLPYVFDTMVPAMRRAIAGDGPVTASAPAD